MAMAMAMAMAMDNMAIDKNNKYSAFMELCEKQSYASFFF
jgi:hypothetical protein